MVDAEIHQARQHQRLVVIRRIGIQQMCRDPDRRHEVARARERPGRRIDRPAPQHRPDRARHDGPIVAHAIDVEVAIVAVPGRPVPIVVEEIDRHRRRAAPIPVQREQLVLPIGLLRCDALHAAELDTIDRDRDLHVPGEEILPQQQLELMRSRAENRSGRRNKAARRRTCQTRDPTAPSRFDLKVLKKSQRARSCERDVATPGTPADRPH